MTARINLYTAAPDGYKTLVGVEGYIKRNVDPTLLGLVKLRASIVNGCAYCVDMHSTDALKNGESTTRLLGLAAWWESPFYTDAERAALRLTDAVTRLGEYGVPDEVWEEAAAHFDERSLADLLIAIAMINLWNRIAIPSRTPPASAA